ncbi:MAG: T9SS type A sorting domain-containing protein, partial [Bacteroidetes bacterium]|nr:T9SS type A sorting domain-containing protein [Bacteroidota bacterium]
YPNPANEKFSIILPISGEDLTIEITDVLGKIVYIEHLLSNGEIEKHINMGSSKGFYFIKVYNSKYNFIGRIMLN